MEQVFSLVNTLLLRDEATAKRELRFQTYTVLPLYNSTGIIEFVPDSMGIGDWLGDAHKRYRPHDIPPLEFRNHLKEIQQGHHSNPNPELITRFIHYRQFFKPVMRHFFTEMRSDPIGWYSMRLKYARSVAVGSMVGHIVGLGDRHCSNIMINNKTGEILHIDLGIAFDQVSTIVVQMCHVEAEGSSLLRLGCGTDHSRTCSIPLDSRHCRWSGFLRSRGSLQTLLRTKFTAVARKVQSHYGGVGSLQA
jgi:phosphatidylinositol kinase/protein kinase (PI-3  family)